MKIHIVGAGFAGLATAYHLALAGHEAIVYSSPNHLGASEIAAGLVHRFVGAHARLNWRGEEAFDEMKKLIRAAESATNLPIRIHKGMLRPALTQEQITDYQANAALFPENQWIDNPTVPGLVQAPALWFPKTYTIHSSNYLAGLKDACLKLGVCFKIEELASSPAEPVIIAAGCNSLRFFPEIKLQLSFTKGQLLRLAWPRDLPPLPYAINSHAYIVMDLDGKSCWAGSSFEKQFEDDQPNVDVAVREIMPKVAEMMPILKNAPILDCQAGIRVGTPNRLPLVKELSPGRWIFTGLGSKGLLYHGLLAKELVAKLSMR